MDFSQHITVLYALYAKPQPEDEGIEIYRETILHCIAILEETVRGYRGNNLTLNNADTSLGRIEQPIFSYMAQHPFDRVFTVGQFYGQIDLNQLLQFASKTQLIDVDHWVDGHRKELVDICSDFMYSFGYQDDMAGLYAQYVYNACVQTTTISSALRSHYVALWVMILATSSRQDYREVAKQVFVLLPKAASR